MPEINGEQSVTRNIAEGIKMHFPNSVEIDESDNLTLVFGSVKLQFDTTGSLIGVDLVSEKTDHGQSQG